MSDDEVTKYRSKKKNTKKWCKGKVGRSHEGLPHYRRASWGNSGVELVCSKCGKQLDWWWPCWKWKDPPEWVPKRMLEEARTDWEKDYM